VVLIIVSIFIEIFIMHYVLIINK